MAGNAVPALPARRYETSESLHQWCKDGIAPVDATNPTLALSHLSAADAGDYSVVITNPGGQLASFQITLTVQSAPVIFVQPVSTVVASGENAGLQIFAGGGDLTYEWRHNGALIADARDAVPRIDSATAADAG